MNIEIPSFVGTSYLQSLVSSRQCKWRLTCKSMFNKFRKYISWIKTYQHMCHMLCSSHKPSKYGTMVCSLHVDLGDNKSRTVQIFMNLNLQGNKKMSQAPWQQNTTLKKTVWELWHKLEKVIRKWEQKNKYIRLQNPKDHKIKNFVMLELHTAKYSDTWHFENVEFFCYITIYIQAALLTEI
jgi:hypothetical protein